MNVSVINVCMLLSSSVPVLVNDFGSETTFSKDVDDKANAYFQVLSSNTYNYTCGNIFQHSPSSFLQRLSTIEAIV